MWAQEQNEKISIILTSLKYNATPIKIGFGAVFILLGLYLINKFIGDTIFVIGGIICISIGVGILASKK